MSGCISTVGVFFLCCLTYTIALNSGQPLPPPTVHAILEGHDLQIKCHATQTPDTEVFWVKNDTKTEFRRNGTELIFNDIQRSASGEYICYSHNVTAEDNNTIIVERDVIDVTYPAEIAGFDVSPTLVVENNIFNVFCNFTGNPVPDFIIMNNRTKRVYVEVRAAVAITDEVRATCEDQAEWICTGRNSLTQGENVTMAANVTVLCGPHPDYDRMKDRYKVHAAVGASPDLVMMNLGNPYPNYTWSHNGHVLPAKMHNDYGFASVLHLYDVQTSDFGDYSLVMENAYGTYYANYQLIPVKSSKSDVQKVTEGDDFQFECHDGNQTEDFEIYWVKNDSTARFRQNGSNLSLPNIQRTAAGEYICYSHNLTSEANASIVQVVRVNVLYPAEISGFHVSPTLVKERSYFEVFCNFTGNPEPDFIIMNNNTKHVYLQARAAISITTRVEATCEDQATWICTGRNILNQGNVTRTGNVTVLCGPHPHYDYMAGKYQVRAYVGTIAKFIMYNYGTAPVNYTWSRNGQSFPPEAHKDFDIGSILSLHDIKVEDFGTYGLDMTNAYGTDHRNYELVPKGTPERPTGLRVTDISHNSAILQWNSGFDMGSQQHFLVMQFYEGAFVEVSPFIFDDSANHGIGGTFEYLLTGLDPDTYYQFDVLADNGQGYGPVWSDDSVGFRTAESPLRTTTTTEFPLLGNCCSVGVIVGASIGGLGVLSFILWIVLIVILRNRHRSYSVLQDKAKHRYQNQPLQLEITPEMKKAALQ